MARKTVTDDFKIFSERLSELMKEQDITQEKLANDLGIKRQTVSLYKNGQSTPDAAQLKNIATFFSVSADWLLGLSNERELNGDIRKICEYTRLNKDSILTLRNFCEHKSDKIAIDFLLSYRDFWENIIAYITSSAWENIPDNILGTYPPSKEELENFKRKRRETKMDIAQLIVEAPSAHLITRPEPKLLEHITFAAVIKELGIMFSEFKAKYCASDAYSQQMALDYIGSLIKEKREK